MIPAGPEASGLMVLQWSGGLQTAGPETPGGVADHRVGAPLRAV